MESWPAVVLGNLLGAGLLSLAAWAVRRWAKRPAVAHALYALALLKLVTPPLFVVPLPYLPEAATPAPKDVLCAVRPESCATTVQGRQALFTPRAMPPEDMVPRIVDAKTGAGIMAPRTSAVYVFDAKKPPSADNFRLAFSAELPLRPKPKSPLTFEGPWALVVALAWAAGAAVVLTRTAYYSARFGLLLKYARPAPESVQALARSVAGRLGLKQCPEIRLMPGSLPPMVWGLGAVRIFFPEALLARLDDEGTAGLLAHELAHVRRGDPWVRLLELVASVVFWWLPPVAWARARMQACEEECCDAFAADLVGPRAYAGAVLEAVDFLAESSPPGPMPALASALSPGDALRERLCLIMQNRTPRRMSGPTQFFVAALAAALLPLMPLLVRAESAPTPEVRAGVVWVGVNLGEFHGITNIDLTADRAVEFASAERFSLGLPARRFVTPANDTRLAAPVREVVAVRPAPVAGKPLVLPPTPARPAATVYVEN